MDEIILKTLGFLHLVGYIFVVLYVLLFPQKVWFDTIFILGFLLINIHWVVLKGECVITLLYKMYFDQTYRVGEAPTRNSDIVDLFGGIVPLRYVDAFILGMLVLYLCNALIVLHRNGFHALFATLVVVSSITYTMLLRTDITLGQKYSIVHLIISVSALMYFVYLVFAMQKNLKRAS